VVALSLNEIYGTVGFVERPTRQQEEPHSFTSFVKEYRQLRNLLVALRPEVVHTGDHNNWIGDQLRQELSELLNHEEVDAILTTSKKKLGDDDREVAPAKSIHVQLDDLENSEIGAAAHETVYRRYIKFFLGSIKILTKGFKKTKN
jgi:hypothetical protein